MGEVIELGVKCGFVGKSGAWYSYNGDKIGQGKANAAKYLEEHPELANEIEDKIRAELLTVAVGSENEKDKTAETEA